MCNNLKRAEVAILASDTIDFKTNCYWRKKKYFYNGKRVNYEEHIEVINIYVPNNRAPKYIMQKLTELKGEKII